MKKILLILIGFLFLSSCNTLYFFTPKYWSVRSDLKKELKLVQKILDNPDKMQEIIETSEFYDNTKFNLNGHTYEEYINYLKSDKNGDAEIISFGRTDISVLENTNSKNYIKIKNAKVIVISKDNKNFKLNFEFYEINYKVIIAGISRVW